MYTTVVSLIVDIKVIDPALRCMFFFFFFQAEDGIRDVAVTGVQTCALPIYHLIVRQGLKSLLEQENCTVVAEAADGREAIQLAQKLHPDVAVMDLAMPLLNGLDATREILKVSPETRTILLTMHTEDPYVVEEIGRAS